jgi:glucose/mannose-6-phosphate isomerase
VIRLEPPYGVADAGDMAARIEGIPDQIEQQLERLAGFRWSLPDTEPAVLAVGAMGGSAIASELSAALDSDRLPRPIVLVRDYRWPAFVRPGALALLCSYSGNTEETLSLYRSAGERGIARVAIATGGTLAEWAARDHVTVAPLPPGSPPRAALFAAWVTVGHLLHALAWSDDPGPRWRDAVAALRGQIARIGIAVPEPANPAKRMARALLGRRVFVYAASERTGAVATRMRHQLHENAKVLGHSALVPELDHNEIVGWERPGDEWKDVSIVVLRDAEDAPEVASRLALTADYAARRGAAVHLLETPPGERLARLAGAVQFADYLSLYLALLRGVDPTPIASIDEFKRRLAERAAGA